MNELSNAIVIQDLHKSFGKVKVLEGVNLNVQKGSMLALLGPNGAGKTTIVRILSTLLNADTGQVLINGIDPARNGNKVRSIIGLTGQYAAVDEYLTGYENLVMMGELYHLGKEKSKKRAVELLEQFDLIEASTRSAKTYSGGMRRRLDLAASLVAHPPIIFLDEPTTGLDPRSRLAMWDVIENLKKEGATILLTTQYLEEADKLADRVVVIDHGKVIAEGTPDELKSQVGRDHLELVISHKEDFAKAIQLLNTKGIQSNEHSRSISFPSEGVASVKSALDTMERAGIAIETLSLQKPTLDDVFLHLTGHAAAESKENHE